MPIYLKLYPIAFILIFISVLFVDCEITEEPLSASPCIYNTISKIKTIKDALKNCDYIAIGKKEYDDLIPKSKSVNVEVNIDNAKMEIISMAILTINKRIERVLEALSLCKT